jgi:hypothetical protein
MLLPDVTYPNRRVLASGDLDTPGVVATLRARI